MLIDPPQYVSVPPALIYQAAGLERENFRALLQIVGWLWVTRRHGRPLGTSVAELAARWGIDDRSAQARLQVMEEGGYLLVERRAGRVYVRLGPGCEGGETNNLPAGEPAPAPGARDHDLPAGEPAPAPGARDQDTPAGEPAPAPGARDHDTPAGGNRRKQPARKQPARKQLARANINNSNVVVVDPDPDRIEQQQQQLIIRALVQAEVFADVAEQLAADEWITEERIAGWYAELAEQKAAGRIGCIGAVLANNLRYHREPPRTAEERERARRRVPSAYEEFVMR